MSFTVNLRNTTISYLEKLAEHDAKLKELEGKKGIYQAEYLRKLMAEEQAKRDAVVIEGEEAIRRITDGYKKDVSARYAPDGSKLTEDAALFNSGLKLTQRDLEGLFDKYAGNQTMQRLIVDYANAFDIHMNRTYISEAAKHDGADTLAKYATGALSDEWRAAFIQSDKYFAQITPESVKGE